MANLMYSALMSLDGYVADERGNFNWGEPDEEVHTFINDLQRSLRTHLYGRKLYEVLSAWETLDTPDQPRYMRDFAEIWQSAEKIVFSRTLESVSTGRTRIERTFAPPAMEEMKASVIGDLLVGGPELAGHAFRAGLVDECHLFVAPVIVGGGKRALPENVRIDLELMDERRFDNGMVYLHHRVTGATELAGRRNG